MKNTGKRSVKLDRDGIAYINSMLAIANVIPKDCVVDDNTVVFLVEEEKIGAAIGKQGKNAETLRKQLKKNVEIMQYAESPEEFIKGALRKVKIKKIENNEGSMIAFLSPEDKRIVMQNSSRIKRIRIIMERNYKIKDFKIR